MRLVADADQRGDKPRPFLGRAALVREAVSDFLERNRRDPREAFGLWRDRGEDGIAYQERLRGEWDA